MIAALALLIAAQTAPPDPPAGNDVVVRYLRKLEDWRAVLVFERDTPTCRIVKSTDDAEIDAIGCTTMVQCFVTTKPRFLALNDRALSPRKRRVMRVAASRAMDDCFTTTRHTMMVDLSNKRAALKQEELTK